MHIVVAPSTSIGGSDRPQDQAVVWLLDVDDALERRVDEEHDTVPLDHDVAVLGPVGQDEPDADGIGHDPDPRIRVEASRGDIGFREQIDRPPRHVDHRSSLRTDRAIPSLPPFPTEKHGTWYLLGDRVSISAPAPASPVTWGSEVPGATMNHMGKRRAQPAPTA